MTTALQKYDIGRVFPTPDALVSLLGDGFAAWIAQHTDARPTNGSTNLALSGGIYDAIHDVSSSISILDNSIAARITAAIGDELAANGGRIDGAISSAIQTLLSGELADLRTLLENQGLSITQFANSIADAVNSKVNERLAQFPNLDNMQAMLEEIRNLDLIKELLGNTEGGKLELGNIVLIMVRDDSTEDNHQVLDLTEPGALNKEYYCITNEGPEPDDEHPSGKARLTIVLPDADYTFEGLNKINNGDSAYIEFRSTGTNRAPIAAILTESQYKILQAEGNPGDAETSVLFGVLTSDNDLNTDDGLNDNAMFSRIRATYAYGKWMAEVVQFTDSKQQVAPKYNVVYQFNYNGLARLSRTDANIIVGSYRLAGEQESYCGMRHIKWIDGSGNEYTPGQTIILERDQDAQAGVNTVLTLHAGYSPYTKALAVVSSFPQDVLYTYARTGGTYYPADIYNAAAVHEALSDWRETAVQIQISLLVFLYGYNNAGADAWAKFSDQEKYGNTLYTTHPSNTLYTISGWFNPGVVFTCNLERTDPTAQFVLPKIDTASQNGHIIPWVSGILFS